MPRRHSRLALARMLASAARCKVAANSTACHRHSSLPLPTDPILSQMLSKQADLDTNTLKDTGHAKLLFSLSKASSSQPMADIKLQTRAMAEPLPPSLELLVLPASRKVWEVCSLVGSLSSSTSNLALHQRLSQLELVPSISSIRRI